jgi:chromate transporter
VERLRSNHAISAALSGITAAVVGVIANLALYFALHTLFSRSRSLHAGILRMDVPVASSLDWTALVITLAAAGLIFGRKWSVLRTIGACAVFGCLASLIEAAT